MHTPEVQSRPPRALCLAGALALLAAAAGYSQTRRQPVTAPHGAVASAHPLASAAGLAMLQRGGNAVDAAVAAAFAVGTVEPQASGVGGEGMLLVYLADTGAAVVVDFRSAAPLSTPPDFRPPKTGYAAVAVPGAVAGLCFAQSTYGRLPREAVLEPAARIAEEGFEASPTLAAAVVEHYAEILENKPLATLFCPGELPIEAGARVRNPALAATLREVGRDGPNAFYRGRIGREIADAAAAGGGFLTMEDLAAYRPIPRAPLTGRYRNATVVTAPGASGGIALIETLQILDRFELAGSPASSPRTVHLVAEALKRGFADFREFVGDPGFVRIPFRGLIDPRYARRRAREIPLDRPSQRVDPGYPDGHESASTTSLVAVDSAGNVAVLTQTISDFFGACVLVESNGVILNNEMKNFSRKGPNAVAPGKRPRTTIAPMVLLAGGRPVAAVATPGAARIVSTSAQLVINLIDYRLGIQEAIEAPRYFARESEKDLFVEARIPEVTLTALRDMGYSIQVLGEYDLFFGGAQGIWIDPASGSRIGGADPRRDGAVAGY
jgi:gamma-glutamyltranspeptidase/glutathione hydrolase